jgi:hypothetical protein
MLTRWLSSLIIGLLGPALLEGLLVFGFEIINGHTWRPPDPFLKLLPDKDKTASHFPERDCLSHHEIPDSRWRLPEEIPGLYGV